VYKPGMVGHSDHRLDMLFLLFPLLLLALAIAPIGSLAVQSDLELESSRKLVIKSVYNEGFMKVIPNETSYEFLLDFPSLMQQNYSDISLQKIPVSLVIKPSLWEKEAFAMEMSEFDIISIKVPTTFVVDPGLFYWELSFAA